MKKKINIKKLEVSQDTSKYDVIEEEEKKDYENELNNQQIISEEEKEKKRQENINALKIKLQKQKEELRNKRLGRNQSNPSTQNSQLEALKKNPLFSNINNSSEEEIKKAVEMMASKMTNDGKQKKNAKKQINQLLSQLKESSNINT